MSTATAVTHYSRGALAAILGGVSKKVAAPTLVESLRLSNDDDRAGGAEHPDAVGRYSLGNAAVRVKEGNQHGGRLIAGDVRVDTLPMGDLAQLGRAQVRIALYLLQQGLRSEKDAIAILGGDAAYLDVRLLVTGNDNSDMEGANEVRGERLDDGEGDDAHDSVREVTRERSFSPTFPNTARPRAIDDCEGRG